MKEEFLGKLTRIEENKPELSFTVGAGGGEISIDFRDGARIIPENIARMVGGIEKLKEIAGQLKSVNYSDFVREFNVETERQQLNDIGQKFIANHFSKGIF